MVALAFLYGRAMIKEQIIQALKDSLATLIESGKLSSEVLAKVRELDIERPKHSQYGDFSTNIALLLAKSAGLAPRIIADLLSQELKKQTFFSKVEVAGPGFINVTLSSQTLASIIPAIARLGSSYGTTMLSPKPKALVEFVSANPTGPLHLGHARGAFVGDALSRMLSAAGFEVSKEFYVNDAGNQVETLARTIYKRYCELFGYEITIADNEYPGANIIEIAQALKKIDDNKWLNKNESVWLEYFVNFGVDYNLSLIKKTLDSVDIKMDSYFHEQVLHDNKSLEQVCEAYQARHMLYEAREAIGTGDKVRRDDSKAARYAHQQEGGIFLKTSLFGDEEDRIIRRKDGRFVYLTADLAYHHQKFLRGFDFIVDVFGGDHAGHIGRLRAGMEALGHDNKKLEFAVVQMVRLVRDGQEVRFSKRTGEVIAIEDLLDEVGKDVARFVFLMRSINSQFDLDINDITKRSQDNPVFYVQYGHARMATILNKAQEAKLWPIDMNNFGTEEIALLNLPDERELILNVTDLAQLVRESALNLEPHRLIYFSQDLVKLFHSYFTKYRHSEKIISDDLAKTKARLCLVYVVKQTIFNALSFLGISAPDYMNLSESEDQAG